MSVTTHYTTFGDATVEFTTIVDGAGDTSIAVSVLPSDARTDTQPLELAASEPVAADIPADIPAAEEPPLTKKKRTLMGVIRAGWFYVFTALGGVLDYGIQRYTDLPLPVGTATVLGGALYGLKRALYPDTLL